MRRLAPLLLPLLLCSCRSKPPAPPPAPIRTAIKPPSITIDPATGWAAAPVDHGMPLFTDDFLSIQYFPPTMVGALLIQRPAATTGYLDGKVSVPTDATLYVALLYQVNDNRLISSAQLADFTHEGWTKNPGIFSTSQPAGQTGWWYVYSHQIPAGPITLTSKSVPDAGVFMIGRPH